VLPATATAAHFHRFSGTIREGGTFAFDAKTKNLGVRNVKVLSVNPGNGRAEGVTTTCDFGTYSLSFGLATAPIPVEENRFAAISPVPDAVGRWLVRFRGEFTHKAQRASGSYRVTGPSYAGYCDTGRLHWMARID
jgi:hypothetical protein